MTIFQRFKSIFPLIAIAIVTLWLFSRCVGVAILAVLYGLCGLNDTEAQRAECWCDKLDGIIGAYNGIPCDTIIPGVGPEPGQSFRITHTPCGTTLMKFWVGGYVPSSGFAWVGLERYGQIVSYSQPIAVDSGVFARLCARIPLDGLSLDTNEYELSLYYTENEGEVGLPQKSRLRDVAANHMRFSSQLVSSVASKKYISPKALYDVIDCWFVGDTFALGVTYSQSNAKLTVLEGVNYNSSIVWSVSGWFPLSVRILNSTAGIFLAEQEALSAGDVLIIATDTVRNLVDTLSVIIHEGLPECAGGNNFSIVVDTGGHNIEEWNCSYVKPAPSMPSLFVHTSPSLSQAIDWTLTVRYYRSGRSDDTSFTVLAVPGGATCSLNNAFGANFFGGEATIRAWVPSLQCGKEFRFSIRGKNPADTQAINYIVSRPGALWYDKLVGKRESNYDQFNSGVGTVDCDADDIESTPNSDGGGGFGIFQLTNFGRVPNAQELWSWKSNCSTGSAVLRSKQIQADTVMAVHRNEATSAPFPLVINPYTILADGTFMIAEHAVAIKRFNGLGHHDFGQRDYIEWVTNHWEIYEYATYYTDSTKSDSIKNYYVDDVCQYFDPSNP